MTRPSCILLVMITMSKRQAHTPACVNAAPAQHVKRTPPPLALTAPLHAHLYFLLAVCLAVLLSCRCMPSSGCDGACCLDHITMHTAGQSSVLRLSQRLCTAPPPPSYVLFPPFSFPPPLAACVLCRYDNLLRLGRAYRLFNWVALLTYLPACPPPPPPPPLPHPACVCMQVHQPAASAASGSCVPPVQLGGPADLQSDTQPHGSHSGQKLCGEWACATLDAATPQYCTWGAF